MSSQPLPPSILSRLPGPVQEHIRKLQQKLANTILQREWAFKEMIHLEEAAEDLIAELEKSAALGGCTARRVRKIESDMEKLEKKIEELEEGL
ncbi:hypothetical protein K440DRAFT_628086 [Wilcoxina mikolae CBS 423.85]|nr:hypothetical protein K440DRAFT_628086 [Wilcoxina mikolae CBS 423.85]